MGIGYTWSCGLPVDRRNTCFLSSVCPSDKRAVEADRRTQTYRETDTERARLLSVWQQTRNKIWNFKCSDSPRPPTLFSLSLSHPAAADAGLRWSLKLGVNTNRQRSPSRPLLLHRRSSQSLTVGSLSVKSERRHMGGCSSILPASGRDTGPCAAMITHKVDKISDARRLPWWAYKISWRPWTLCVQCRQFGAHCRVTRVLLEISCREGNSTVHWKFSKIVS